MRTKIVELTNGINWGKFLLARFDEAEWAHRSGVDGESRVPLLIQTGWTDDHVWVLDLQTGEGALFRPGGNARADLEKHAIWVCPMFPVFLVWFYAHRECWRLENIPEVLTLDSDAATMAASALWGRRHGSAREGGRG